MINNEPKTIPGAIAIAFSTRRKQFLTMGLAELRKNATEGPPSQEEYERVLNALEMATTDLWEMQDCIAAMNSVRVDIDSNLKGMFKLTNQLFEIGLAAQKGSPPIPDGGPDVVREYFKKLHTGEPEDE